MTFPSREAPACLSHPHGMAGELHKRYQEADTWKIQRCQIGYFYNRTDHYRKFLFILRHSSLSLEFSFLLLWPSKIDINHSKVVMEVGYV